VFNYAQLSAVYCRLTDHRAGKVIKFHELIYTSETERPFLSLDHLRGILFLLMIRRNNPILKKLLKTFLFATTAYNSLRCVVDHDVCDVYMHYISDVLIEILRLYLYVSSTQYV